MRELRLRAAILAVLVASGGAACADDAQPPYLSGPSVATSLPKELADPGGLRTTLAEKGVLIQLNAVGEVFGNAAGGIKREAIGEGFFEPVIDADLAKLIGAEGLTFHANAYLIGGHGLTGAVDNLLTISSIEATPAARLQQLWLQQSFDNGLVTLRAGQLAADSEFITSTYAGLFLNSTFGWPEITAADLPSGGPAYPLASPGLRLQVNPTKDDSVLLAVFDGDPSGPGPGDPQRRNTDGLAFRVADPPLLMGEWQHKLSMGTGDAALAGTVKAGAWGHLGRFDDQRFDTDGLPLASPLSNGDPRDHRGNYGLYGIIDQQIFRQPGEDATKGIGLFARVLASPQGDRNLIDLYVDAGVNVAGLVPARPDDSFGVAVAYAGLGSGATGFDRDSLSLPGASGFVRDSEIAIEATYQAQIVPGWSIQPDVQYIFAPGGGTSDPLRAPGTPVRSAAVFGLRTTINY